MKTIFYRLKIGIIKGFETPNLPMHIIKLQLHPLIRIFRVLSGISLLLILTKKIYNFHEVFLYLAVFNSIMFFVYHLYISYYRIKHIKSIIKNKDLEIRNSPLDKLASIAAKLIFCLKGACDQAAPIGISLGIMSGIDTMLEYKGRNAVFLPFIVDALKPDSDAEKIYKERRKLFIETNKLDNNFTYLKEYKETIDNLENSKLFSKEDIEYMKTELRKQETILIENKDDLIKKIKENLDKTNPKN